MIVAMLSRTVMNCSGQTSGLAYRAVTMISATCIMCLIISLALEDDAIVVEDDDDDDEDEDTVAGSDVELPGSALQPVQSLAERFFSRSQKDGKHAISKGATVETAIFVNEPVGYPATSDDSIAAVRGI